MLSTLYLFTAAMPVQSSLYQSICSRNSSVFCALFAHSFIHSFSHSMCLCRCLALFRPLSSTRFRFCYSRLCARLVSVHSKLNHTTPLSLSLTKYCSFRITSSVFSIHARILYTMYTLSLRLSGTFFIMYVYRSSVYWNKYCCRVLQCIIRPNRRSLEQSYSSHTENHRFLLPVYRLWFLDYLSLSFPLFFLICWISPVKCVRPMSEQMSDFIALLFIKHVQAKGMCCLCNKPTEMLTALWTNSFFRDVTLRIRTNDSFVKSQRLLCANGKHQPNRAAC